MTATSRQGHHRRTLVAWRTAVSAGFYYGPREKSQRNEARKQSAPTRHQTVSLSQQRSVHGGCPGSREDWSGREDLNLRPLGSEP